MKSTSHAGLSRLSYNVAVKYAWIFRHIFPPYNSIFSFLADRKIGVGNGTSAAMIWTTKIE